MFNVLIVEDDQKLNQLIKTTLIKNGYNAYTAKDGDEGIDVFDNNYIDLIVSDIMMPNADGYELADAVRKRNANIPILFVSAKDKYEDKQKGFQIGIDDYMVKPIDLNELLLRISALLRRAQIANERKLTVGSTVLDYDTMTVIRDGSEIILPQKEFKLLFKLLSFPNKIFT
ncbi:MAG: response regulator transcription factor, partial [Clostridia bacterium]|nr:response regulator transcription factor [Clostridia bacterium]